MKLQRQYDLAIDPGLRNTGWAIYCHVEKRFILTGVIVTPRDDSQTMSVNNILGVGHTVRTLHALLEKYPCRRIVAELPMAGAKSSRANTAISMASALTVALSVCNGLNLQVVWPQQIKRVVASIGAVSKKQVIAFVLRHYGEDVLPMKNALKEHAADAIMAYHAWKNRY